MVTQKEITEITANETVKNDFCMGAPIAISVLQSIKDTVSRPLVKIVLGIAITILQGLQNAICSASNTPSNQ